MPSLVRRFAIGSTILLLYATLPCFSASVHMRQGVDATGRMQSSDRTAISLPEFEVKFAQGEVLVRQKGTSEWKQSSKLKEPVAVGIIDGDQKIYVGTKAIKPPKPTHMQSPNYPPGETSSGLKRLVYLHIVVDEHGVVRSPSVDASPGPAFTQAALEAVKKWSFEPAKLDNQPIAVLVSITLSFQ